MRFLIVESDYYPFLNWLYSQHVGLESEGYEKQTQLRVDSFFGDGAYYSRNLRKLDHEANVVFVNNEYIQTAWAREHGLKINTRWQFRLRRRFVPWLSRMKDKRWLYDILTAQIKHFKPDVLLNDDMSLAPAYFREMKPYFR
jgi:hypothetical protein